jgi:predicted DNA binding protein
MVVLDARIRIRHPCPYCDISLEFPEALFLLWCDNRRDTFLVSAPEEPELHRVLAALRVSFHANVLVADGTEALVEVPDFEWSTPPSVTSLARNYRVWVLHPVVYFGGTESYRMIAPARSAFQRLINRLRALGDVEILSISNRTGLENIRDLPAASVHFFEGLTDRQARCLVSAYEEGLLDVPARSKWGDVARRQGLSRSTFGEHLRKGQYRLLANSYASLKARTMATETGTILPATRAASRVRRTPLQGTRASR